MKCGQIIKCNRRHIFLKIYSKCGGETIPTPFSKYQQWGYYWIKSLKFHTVSLYAKLRATKAEIEKQKKKKKRFSEISLPASFSAQFLKKNISLVILYYLTKLVHYKIMFANQAVTS